MRPARRPRPISLDVAADVSPTENVELLNQGLWIYNKDGSVPSGVSETTTSPYETLKAFWCPAGGNLPDCGTAGVYFTDTQIVFDPFNQRWLATSMPVIGSTPTGNLYFAYTTTASAFDTPDNWKRWYQPISCASGYSPDQPILGYDIKYIGIDTACVGTNIGADYFILIPQTDVTNGTFNPVPKTLPDTLMRPSRDVSASGYPYLMLAASQVPGSSYAVPYLALAQIDDFTGTVTSLGNSPAIGYEGSFIIPNGPQPNCTTYQTGCMIAPGDARVTSAAVQRNIGDGNHYLLVSFPTSVGLQGNGGPTSQILTFVDQLETGAWNASYLYNFDVVSYPTVSADEDLDIYQTYAEFTSTQYPSSSWTLMHGFGTNPGWQTISAGTLTSSSGTHTGEYSCNPPPGGAEEQPWGDYMTTLYDPSVTSSSGEAGAFWTVQEFTTGGTNESTEWSELSDPFPFYVGNTKRESECPNGPGQPCTLTLPVPANAEPGDVLLAAVSVYSQPPGLTIPSSWTRMPIVNHNNAEHITSSDSCGFYNTGWIFAKAWGGNSSSFNFTFTPQLYTTCEGQVYAEIEGMLLDYRGAGQDLSSYVIHGKPVSSDVSSLSVGPLTPQNRDEELAVVFQGASPVNENSESGGDSTTFSAPTGNPALTPEMTLSPITAPFLAADVSVPVNNLLQLDYGPYATSNTGVDGLWFGWQIEIPEQ